MMNNLWLKFVCLSIDIDYQLPIDVLIDWYRIHIFEPCIHVSIFNYNRKTQKTNTVRPHGQKVFVPFQGDYNHVYLILFLAFPVLLSAAADGQLISPSRFD